MPAARTAEGQETRRGEADQDCHGKETGKCWIQIGRIHQCSSMVGLAGSSMSGRELSQRCKGRNRLDTDSLSGANRSGSMGNPNRRTARWGSPGYLRSFADFRCHLVLAFASSVCTFLVQTGLPVRPKRPQPASLPGFAANFPSPCSHAYLQANTPQGIRRKPDVGRNGTRWSKPSTSVVDKTYRGIIPFIGIFAQYGSFFLDSQIVRVVSVIVCGALDFRRDAPPQGLTHAFACSFGLSIGIAAKALKRTAAIAGRTATFTRIHRDRRNSRR